MAWQMWAVIVAALALVFLHEALIHADHKRAMARLREDQEVAELEALFEMDWQWP